jgi:hypothetical protein
MEKTYLGDGVYAESDGYHLILTTNNGIRDTSTIFLDPDVRKALARVLKGVDRPTQDPPPADPNDDPKDDPNDDPVIKFMFG